MSLKYELQKLTAPEAEEATLHFVGRLEEGAYGEEAELTGVKIKEDYPALAAILSALESKGYSAETTSLLLEGASLAIGVLRDLAERQEFPDGH